MTEALPIRGRALKIGTILCAAVLALLVLAPAGRAQVLAPTLVLGPITVGPDGLVTVTGNVGGASLADATVSVNGQSFPVIDGQFVAQVRVLTDQNLLEIRLGNDVIRIPLNLDLLGLSDPLQLLRDAGLSLLIPPGGLQIVDGLPLVIQGTLLDRSKIVEFKIAGIDVLSLLNPDGSFSVPVPGSTETVDVSVTDTRGVSQTSSFAVAHFAQTPFGRVRCTIVGTAGNDVLSGTSGRDVICGLGGNDRMNGRGGNDDLVGAGGRDTMAGSLGRDRIAGGAANDRAGGGRGADRMWGGVGGDRLAGGAALDRMDGGRGNDRLFGNAGNDRMKGGAGADRMSGGAGRDFTAARDGRRDVVFGGPGRDAGRFDRFDRNLAVERRV
jgi:Ca2+-binding RTX toxin-like protein